MPDNAGSNALEPESVGELFTALEAPLLRYAFKLTQDEDTSQDLVQDAFMKLHTHFDTVRQPRPWLYRTIHNLAMNHHRDRKKIVSVDFEAEDGDADVPVNVDPLPDEYLQRMEAIGHARLGLKALDERKRELLRLKFEEGLSYKEISSLMEITVGNVGFILHHALKELAKHIKTAGGEA